MALIKLSSNYRQFFPRNYIARGWNGADNRRNFCCTGATCDPLLVHGRRTLYDRFTLSVSQREAIVKRNEIRGVKEIRVSVESFAFDIRYPRISWMESRPSQAIFAAVKFQTSVNESLKLGFSTRICRIEERFELRSSKGFLISFTFIITSN